MTKRAALAPSAAPGMATGVGSGACDTVGYVHDEPS